MTQTPQDPDLIGSLLRDVRALQEGQRRLGEAVDQNTETFQNALQYHECLTHIMLRVLNDSINGCLVTRPAEEPGLYTVDLEYYRHNFAVCMVMADFAKWLSGLSSHKEPERSAEDDAVIFGG